MSKYWGYLSKYGSVQVKDWDTRHIAEAARSPYVVRYLPGPIGAPSLAEAERIIAEMLNPSTSAGQPTAAQAAGGESTAASTQDAPPRMVAFTTFLMFAFTSEQDAMRAVMEAGSMPIVSALKVTIIRPHSDDSKTKVGFEAEATAEGQDALAAMERVMTRHRGYVSERIQVAI